MSEEVCCKSLVCEHRDPMSLCDFLMTHHKVSLGEQSHAGASSPEINFPILEAVFVFSRFRVLQFWFWCFRGFYVFMVFVKNHPKNTKTGRPGKRENCFFAKTRNCQNHESGNKRKACVLVFSRFCGFSVLYSCFWLSLSLSLAVRK